MLIGEKNLHDAKRQYTFEEWKNLCDCEILKITNEALGLNDSYKECTHAPSQYWEDSNYNPLRFVSEFHKRRYGEFMYNHDYMKTYVAEGTEDLHSGIVESNVNIEKYESAFNGNKEYTNNIDLEMFETEREFKLMKEKYDDCKRRFDINVSRNQEINDSIAEEKNNIISHQAKIQEKNMELLDGYKENPFKLPKK